MSETRFTPGPWKAVKSNSGHDIIALVMQYSDTQFVNDAHMYHLPQKENISWKMGVDGNLYASLAYETWRQFPMAKWDEQQAANARLIAAAPDLYEACKALQAEAKARNCGLRIADEAIAKAEAL